MVDVSSSVKTVIEVLHDGHEGFAQIGEHFEDPRAKAFFLEESAARHKFEHELKNAAGLESLRMLAARRLARFAVHGAI